MILGLKKFREGCAHTGAGPRLIDHLRCRHKRHTQLASVPKRFVKLKLYGTFLRETKIQGTATHSVETCLIYSFFKLSKLWTETSGYIEANLNKDNEITVRLVLY